MKIISFLFCSSYLLYGASHAHSPSDFSVPNPMQPATEEVLPKETTREAVPQKTKKKERKRPLFMYSLTPDLRGKAKFLKEKQPHNKEAEK